eukprot:jgi/Psemu1/23363/gm1.23363_g
MISPLDTTNTFLRTIDVIGHPHSISAVLHSMSTIYFHVSNKTKQNDLKASSCKLKISKSKCLTMTIKLPVIIGTNPTYTITPTISDFTDRITKSRCNSLTQMSGKTLTIREDPTSFLGKLKTWKALVAVKFELVHTIIMSFLDLQGEVNKSIITPVDEGLSRCKPPKCKACQYAKTKKNCTSQS